MNNWIESEVTHNRHWTPELCSLHIATELPPFEAGQFIRIALDIDGERIARPYSLVNPPDTPLAEIYFNRVPNGPLSTRLFELAEGDRLWLSDSAAGFFVLSELPAAKHLWLLATGTGIGPYLSILQTPMPWQRFEKIVLVHGIKQARDQSYLMLIEGLVQENPQQLVYVPAITREPGAGLLQCRITEALTTGQLEQVAQLQISAQDSQVMICGNPGFVAETLTLLQARGLRKNLRSVPGQITREIYK